MSLLFCATYPERVSSLVLYGAMARSAWAPDNPWGRTDAQLVATADFLEKSWGSGSSVDFFAPSVATIPEYRQWRARLDRAGATPGAAIQLGRMNHAIDVRHVLDGIQAPTLVMHRASDRVVKIEHSRFIADTIPNAKYLELAGVDHAPWVGDSEAIISAIREFATAPQITTLPARALATIVFVDAKDLPPDAGSSGREQWRARALEEITKYGGRRIRYEGAAQIGVFDGPIRAVRFAQALVGAPTMLRKSLRIGIHMMECDVWADTLSEPQIRISSLVASTALPGEVVGTGAVGDLLAGSGLSLLSRGERTWPGVPGIWSLLVLDGVKT